MRRSRPREEFADAKLLHSDADPPPCGPLGVVGITYATLIGAGTLTAQWHRATTRRLVGAGSVLLAIALFVSLAVALVVRGRELDPVELGGSYVAAVACMAGVAVVVLAAFLWALRGALLDPPAADRVT